MQILHTLYYGMARTVHFVVQTNEHKCAGTAEEVKGSVTGRLFTGGVYAERYADIGL